MQNDLRCLSHTPELLFVDCYTDIASDSRTLITRWITPGQNAWAEVYRVEDNYSILFPDICEFRFSKSQDRVYCSILAKRSKLDVEHLFHNTVIPLLLSIRGRAVYHAGAVRVNERAVVFMGASGSGKSSLAASFALSGYPFLTDDVLPIGDGLPPLACPHASSVRLWKSSVDGLFPRGCEVEPYSTYTTKTRVVAGIELQHSNEPADVTAAFVLGDGKAKQIEIRELDGGKAHAAWFENMFILDHTDRKVVRQLFERTAEIAGSVPSFSLNFPRGFELLPQVRREILSVIAR